MPPALAPPVQERQLGARPGQLGEVGIPEARAGGRRSLGMRPRVPGPVNVPKGADAQKALSCPGPSPWAALSWGPRDDLAVHLG